MKSLMDVMQSGLQRPLGWDTHDALTPCVTSCGQNSSAHCRGKRLPSREFAFMGGLGRSRTTPLTPCVISCGENRATRCRWQGLLA